MQVFKAPLRDMRFVVHELYDSEELSTALGFEDATTDLIDTILEEAAKLSEQVLFPLNASGDLEGCHYENGVVRTPTGFKEAYSLFKDGGWTGIASDPAYGGQGLPKAVNALVEEMICASNLSFGMYPGLSHGAYLALHAHGSEALKDRYLPKMVDGTWAGTMCLTEPQCGTDLGLLRTRAEPQDDGSYVVTGSKIFISAGEHDLTENIVHLVLARMPGAPKGVKGISLFLVPKFLPVDGGKPGPRNGVSCAGIEHKMGIKASATCQINFDESKGWLVGEKHKGMQAMFTMMNSERLSVGIQGLGVAEAAYQSAVFYAKDRLQGRSLSGTKHPEKSADAAATTGTAVGTRTAGTTVADQPGPPAGSALTGRVGRARPTVTGEDSASTAIGLRQGASRNSVGAVTDQRAPQQRRGGRVHRVEQTVLDGL